jgi:epoxide hydrolase-like predicted phosphatase
LNRNAPRLEAIVFDLMGVLLLLREDYAGDKIVDPVDDRIGGVTDDDGFRKEILVRFRIDETEFQRILSHIPDKYEPFEPLWDLLPELRRKYKLGILNNGTRLTFPYFDAKLNLTQRFDAVISSGAEGVRKPDPRIYRLACERLGTEPRRCLYMDDAEAHIRGAEALGMQTIFWRDRETGFRLLVDKIKLNPDEI